MCFRYKWCSVYSFLGFWTHLKHSCIRSANTTIEKESADLTCVKKKKTLGKKAKADIHRHTLIHSYFFLPFLAVFFHWKFIIMIIIITILTTVSFVTVAGVETGTGVVDDSDDVLLWVFLCKKKWVYLSFFPSHQNNTIPYHHRPDRVFSCVSVYFAWTYSTIVTLACILLL